MANKLKNSLLYYGNLGNNNKEISGFGLRGLFNKPVIKQFSWEWFSKDKSGYFIQYPEGSRVALKTKKCEGIERIVLIKLIDDVTIDIKIGNKFETLAYQIVILKGSELIFPKIENRQ